MLVTVRACDICRAVGDEIATYRIGKGDAEREVDLCAGDAAPLEKILAVAGKPVVDEKQENAASPPAEVELASTTTKTVGESSATEDKPRRSTGRKRPAVKVKTMEEIEASKAGD